VSPHETKGLKFCFVATGVGDPHHSNADTDPSFHFNSYQDPSFHLNANSDPDTHQVMRICDHHGSIIRLFTRMLIWIQVPKIIRFHADLDPAPQPWLSPRKEKVSLISVTEPASYGRTGPLSGTSAMHVYYCFLKTFLS
jgi:hypothetical protein